MYGAQILGITPLKSYIALGIMAWGGAGNGRGVATFGAEHATHACDGTQPPQVTFSDYTILFSTFFRN